MISISICMIVKNEEKVLERCLNSLYGIADELIIVDTGSTDRTKEIAAKYTDNVYEFEWTGSFSDARNYSFSKASCDYIYCADADEEMDKVNRNRFLELKNVLLEEIDVVQMYYCNQLERGSVYNYDKEYRPKLYKRVRLPVWEEAIHEAVRLNPIIYDSDIEIIHRPTISNANRDLEAFAKIIHAEGKLSKRLEDMYAKELYMAGDCKHLTVARSYFERVCDDNDSDSERILQASCVLVRGLRIKDDYLNMYKYAMKAVVCGSCSEVCYELGLYYISEKDYDEAIVWLYNAVYETEPIISIKTGRELSIMSLIECYEKIGMDIQADEYRAELDRLYSEVL